MDFQYPLDPQTGVQNSQLTYSSGNPNNGTLGSFPPAESVAYTMREIVNLIQGAGISPSNGDLAQALKAVQALISRAIGAIPPAPVAPVYTGSQGVAIDGSHNATLDVASLPQAGSIGINDYLAALVGGADERVSVQALATAILQGVVSAGAGIGITPNGNSEQIALKLSTVPGNDNILSTDFIPYFHGPDGGTYLTSLYNISQILHGLTQPTQVSKYTLSTKQAIGNLVSTAAAVSGAGNGYCSPSNSNGAVTILKDGLYTVNGSVTMEQSSNEPGQNVTGCFFAANLLVNGADPGVDSSTYACAFYYCQGANTVSQTMYLHAGDKVQIAGTAGQSAWSVNYTNIMTAFLSVTNIL